MTIILKRKKLSIKIEGRILEEVSEPELLLLEMIPTISLGSVVRTGSSLKNPILVDSIKVTDLNPEYQCSKCGFILSSEYDLKMHDDIVHPEQMS